MSTLNKRIVGLLAVAAALCGGAWLGRADSRAQSPAGSAAPSAAAIPEPVAAGQESKIQNPKSKISKAGALHLQGVSTCASAACHGGPEAGRPDEKWRSAYTVWAAQDQHARAYSVLFEKPAKLIVSRLKHLDMEHSFPWKEERCLACHSTAGSPVEGVDRSALLADGVGCEACHGPAERWLGEHTKSTWPARPDRYGPDWGMRNTSDLHVRAATCAGCHVGSPANGDEPARDVNHELIAAGHPRLYFEFGAFMSNMPRHWDDRADRARHPDYEAQVWAIGQTAAATAALAQLAARAEQVEKRPHVEDLKHPGPQWPEFSEYECFACHHDLGERSYRDRYSAAQPRRHPPGTLPWGTWYFSEIDFLAKLAAPAEASQCRGELESLAREMALPRPDPEKVRRMAKDAAATLARVTTQAERQPFDARRLDEALRAAVQEASGGLLDWDEAAQGYLALVALDAARRELPAADGKAPPHEEQITAALTDLRRLLEFPIEIVPGKGSSVPPEKIKFDSPRNFDPSQFQKALLQLRRLLPAEEH